MADGKNTIVFYRDWKDTFESLNDKNCAELIRHIFRYVNDENPETDNEIVNIAFIQIKNTLKRDLRKWENIKHIRSEAGKKGGRPKKQTKAKKAKGFLKKQTKAKKAVSVSVSDSVSVSEEKKYIYTHFYDEELEKSENNEEYQNLLKFLFGANPLHRPLNKVLAMKEQLSWEQFQSALILKKEYNVMIGEILLAMEEWPDLKKRITVMGTMRTFIKRTKK